MRKRFSLRQILVVTFALICVLPVASLAIWMRYGIQANALDEAREKNQILAQHLATPLHDYLQGADRALAGMSSLLEPPELERATASAAKHQRYFHTLLLLSREGVARHVIAAGTPSAHADAQLAAAAAPFFGKAQGGQSGLLRDPYRGEPTVLFAKPVGDQLLVGLLDVQPLIALGRQFKFGAQGHAAITDQHGNVLLHPNSQWMREIHNIADWPIIQSALQGKSGVARLQAPLTQEDLVAGYAAVPEFHWVVITPQPLAEFQARADALLRNAAWVAAASVLLALILAGIISGLIARPIVALAKAVQRLPGNGYRDEFEEMASIAPQEFDTLQRRSKQMAKEVRNAIGLRDRMNDELALLVERATRRLRDANIQLAQQALVDDLTKLSNRRALWQRISDLEQAQGDSYLPVQVLLFDLDNFKDVNDTLGHAAGDQVLMHVASILEQETRNGDFVVRYGGDEFLVVMQHCAPGIANERAQAIRRAVLAQPLVIEGRSIAIHMSVGIAESESQLSRPSFNELLKAADLAMYATKAKNKRRNHLASI